MPPRLLIVDDLPSNRLLLEEALTDCGAELVTATGGRHALDIVRDVHPEVVLLDWQMPDMDGAATARRIKAAEDVPFTYVVLLSGYQAAELHGELAGCGADLFLGKPYKLDALRAAVTEGLRIALERRAPG